VEGGTRLNKGSTTYGWDAINRMTSLGTSSSYMYRADGMRVSKTVSGATTKYRYDGQMSERSGDPEPKADERSESGGMEDDAYHGDSNGYTYTLSQYGLGARGIDYIHTVRTTGGSTGGGTTTSDSFPVYDGHGNMVATLARSGNNSYALGNQRSFDAWGLVRQGATTGDPTGRYCGSLGHKQDDESGLIYMRARYYEPTSGRFVSEDPGAHGNNWFSYCSGNLVDKVDASGRIDISIVQLESWISQLILSSMVAPSVKMFNLATIGMLMAMLAVEGVVFAADNASFLAVGPKLGLKAAFTIDALGAVQGTIPGVGCASPAMVAVAQTDAESLRLQLLIWILDI
jgi:RHS repeat-associated protein